jgi:hypothetical protein
LSDYLPSASPTSTCPVGISSLWLIRFNAVILPGAGRPERAGRSSSGTILGHHGVLFLDEVCELPRSHLEALRQPLEEREVSMARTRGAVQFPADFGLTAKDDADDVKGQTLTDMNGRHASLRGWVSSTQLR